MKFVVVVVVVVVVKPSSIVLTYRLALSHKTSLLTRRLGTLVTPPL